MLSFLFFAVYFYDIESYIVTKLITLSQSEKIIKKVEIDILVILQYHHTGARIYIHLKSVKYDIQIYKEKVDK